MSERNRLEEASQFGESGPLGMSQPVSGSRITPTSVSRRCILVVDDLVDAADTLHALLAGLGHEVQVSYSGAAALRALQAQPFEIALIDICMPGMSGFELARHIRAADAARPFLIAVTGLGSREILRQAKDAGFDHFVLKPYEVESLEALLASARTEHG